MPRRSESLRLEQLRSELEAVARTIQVLADDGSLNRLADHDPARWVPVLGALADAVDPALPGSVAKALDAVKLAISEG